MCVNTLIASGGATERLRKKYRHKKQFIGYKVLRRSGNVFKTDVAKSVIEPGIIIAKRRDGEPLNQLYKYSAVCPAGIHVYRSKRTAQRNAGNWKYVIRVICNIKDLILSDNEQAAFRAVYIDPVMWAEDLRLKQKEKK